MTKAHELFRLLSMDLEKGESTRYPASRAPMGQKCRYWATEVGGAIQFGVQLRAPSDEFSPREITRLTTFGFQPRPNEREYFVTLPANLPEASILARAAIQLLDSIILQT